MPLLWTLPSNDLLLEKMRQDLPIVLPNAWRRPEAGRRGFGKPREGTREFHGNSELGFINVLPEIAILEMGVFENVPRVGHRIAQHLALKSLCEEFCFRVELEQLCRGLLDFVDLFLSAGFNAEPVPVLIQKRAGCETVLGHPLDQGLVRAPAGLAAIDDEIEVAVLAFVNSSHARPGHAASGEAASA